jgi:hypothetical protein
LWIDVEMRGFNDFLLKVIGVSGVPIHFRISVASRDVSLTYAICGSNGPV